MLNLAWSDYKDVYIMAPGYVIDRTRNGGQVTSEGQAYALLRAAWMRDQAAFERVYAWTDSNLRRSDGLHSWLWSPQAGGKILDANSATDADQDIAFALILASYHFHRPDYLERSRGLLRAIRKHTGIDVAHGWVPSAGNWAVGERIVNLSYFTPYAYPYFDKLDPEDKWLDAANSGYTLLADTLSKPEVRLIPDFMTVDNLGIPNTLPDNIPLSRHFSFDAIRIFWRVSLDCRLNHRMQACADPAGTSTMVELMRRWGRIFTEYEIQGNPLKRDESPTFYACLLSSLDDYAPASARAVRNGVLSPGNLVPVLRSPDRYYDLNWIWFGLALAEGVIIERTPALAEIR